MKTPSSSRKRGFTLMETVIAIGVLAVLLTGFIIVFAPAAAGIRKSINVQEADRLASTLEQELVTLRKGDSEKTGFEKAFNLISKSYTASEALLIYQYRGSLTNTRTDGTPEPMANINGKLPGEEYSVQPMVRSKSDSNFNDDLPAVDGGVYLVKCRQLVFNSTKGVLEPGEEGQIIDPKGTHSKAANADAYPEAVIAFTADFYMLPAKAGSYFGSGGKFTSQFDDFANPVFTRNLAVRR